MIFGKICIIARFISHNRFWCQRKPSSSARQLQFKEEIHLAIMPRTADVYVIILLMCLWELLLINSTTHLCKEGFFPRGLEPWLPCYHSIHHCRWLTLLCAELHFWRPSWWLRWWPHLASVESRSSRRAPLPKSFWISRGFNTALTWLAPK